MKEIKHLLFIKLFIVMGSSLSYAGSQAKFLLTPTTPTHMQLAFDQTATVQYIVLNQTKTTRTLTMVPIASVSQTTTSGGNVCTSPFTLAPNESCLLTLQINQLSVGNSVITGPQVCKTKSASDQSPDPFLCSQPQTSNQLRITRIFHPTRQRLTINPTSLSLIANSSTAQTITVTNNSQLTVTNVAANFTGTALNNHITQDATDCASIAPNASCTLTFTPLNTAVTTTSFPIQGDIFNAVGASIQIVDPEAPVLTVTNSPLIVQTGSTGTLNVQNTSTTVAAYNVTANPLPTALSNASVTATTCTGPIAPSGICVITFDATATTTPVSSTEVTISAQNSNNTHHALTNASVAISGVAELSLNPASLTLPGNGTTTGTIIITNNGTLAATGVEANFSQTALNGYVTATTCDNIPANGGTCSMVFTPGYTGVSATSFPITTTSTPAQTVVGTLTIDTVKKAYLTIGASSSTPPVSLCDISASTGNISACVDSGATMVNQPLGIGINPNKTYVYMANFGTASSSTEYFVTVCQIDPSTKELSGYCAELVDSTIFAPSDVTVNSKGDLAYVANLGHQFMTANGTTVSVCPIQSDGTFGACTSTGNLFNGPADVALNSEKSLAYVTNFYGNSIAQCVVGLDGNLSNCITTTANNTQNAQPTGIVMDPVGAYVYTADFIYGAIIQCPIDQTTGYLTGCNTAFKVSVSGRFTDLAINSTNTILYLSSAGGGIGAYQCPISTVNGVSTITSCTPESGISSKYGIAVMDN